MALVDEKQIDLLKPKKKSKYNARRVSIDGHTFDSKQEAARYIILKQLQEHGDISNLQLQVVYKFKSGIKYRADFIYWLHEKHFRRWIGIVEDVKSEATRKVQTYVMKKKLMLSEFGIMIFETSVENADAIIKGYIGKNSK